MSSSDNTKIGQRLSWKKAGSVLSETERNRLCCVLLTCFESIKPTSEEFELAAAQFGSAKGGFTRMYQDTIKKLKTRNLYIIEGENLDDIPEPALTAKTPTSKKTGATKRKTSDEGTEGESEAVKSPTKQATKKPRTSKAKSKDTVKPEDEDEEIEVKAEAQYEVTV